MTTLNIGGVPEHFNLPWHLALEQQAFDPTGLTFNWTDMLGGTGEMVQQFKEGKLDVAVILTEGIIKAILEGLDVKIIGVYVVSPLHWGIHVPFHSNYKQVEELKDKVFAISRRGSGSELMTYVLANREGWQADELRFKEVKNADGAMAAFDAGEAQGFLWEKRMTFPYYQKEECRYIDELLTPWPPFLLVAKTDVYQKYRKELDHVFDLVNQFAASLKSDQTAVSLIADRFQLSDEQVGTWLKETVWNFESKNFTKEIGQTVDFLTKIGIIRPESAFGWQGKLFLS